MSDLIQAHAAYLRAAGYSPHSIRIRIELLHRLDQALPYGVDHPNDLELARWFGQYRGWTLYTYWEQANAYYVWATAGRDPHLEFNPMDSLRRPKIPHREPRPATVDQIATALEHLTAPWRIGVLLAVASGLRCAEICALDREHVDQDTMYVHRKGAKTQLLPTHAAVWPELAGLPPGPIVRTVGGHRFPPDGYSRRASRALTAIGLDLTMHRFRASYATRLADNGVHARVIQDLMGHASLITTQGYIQVREEQRRLATKTLLIPASHLKEAA